MTVTLKQLVSTVKKLLDKEPAEVKILEQTILNQYGKHSIEEIVGEAAPGCKDLVALLKKANENLSCNFNFFVNEQHKNMVSNRNLAEHKGNFNDFQLAEMLLLLVLNEPNQELNVNCVFDRFMLKYNYDFLSAIKKNGHEHLKNFLDCIKLKLKESSPIKYDFYNNDWFILPNNNDVKITKGDNACIVSDSKNDVSILSTNDEGTEKKESKETDTQLVGNRFISSVPFNISKAITPKSGQASIQNDTMDTVKMYTEAKKDDRKISQSEISSLGDKSNGDLIIKPFNATVKGLISKNSMHEMFAHQLQMKSSDPIVCSIRLAPVYDYDEAAWAFVVYEEMAFHRLTELEALMDSKYKLGSLSSLRMKIGEVKEGIMCAAKMVQSPCEGKRRRAVVTFFNERTEQVDVEFIDYLSTSRCDVEALYYLAAGCGDEFATGPALAFLEKRERPESGFELYTKADLEKLVGKPLSLIAIKAHNNLTHVVSMQYLCPDSGDKLDLYHDASTTDPHIFAIRTKYVPPPSSAEFKDDFKLLENFLKLEKQLDQLIEEKKTFESTFTSSLNVLTEKLNNLSKEIAKMEVDAQQ